MIATNSTTRPASLKRLRAIWRGMKSRCQNPNDQDFPKYGGVGRFVCEQWQDFAAFADWALANGYKDGLQIDRLNNNFGYSPDNCRWTDYEGQANNRWDNRRVDAFGERKTLAEWTRDSRCKVSPGTFIGRLNRGWAAERAMTESPQPRYTGKPAGAKQIKPAKPYAGFPLFPHATGRWAKKIRGKLHYFGRWDDPNGALARYVDQREALHAGRTPRATGDGLTVADLVNRFLTAKESLVDTGELQPRTWQDYYVVCERIVRVFGRNRLASDLAVDDFAKLRADFAKTRGPVSITGDITRARVMFKWGVDEGLILTPLRYGQSFNRPSRKTIRLARAANGPKLFERDEVLAMLGAAKQPLRTMLLLAINGGLGNADVAKVPISSLNTETGWLNFPRPKTGIPRRIPLWPETIESLRVWLAEKPPHKVDAADGLVFVTRAGGSWSKTIADNPVCKETAKLLQRLGLHRSGLNFYSLRRTFRTIASEARDEPAADAIMGHAPRSDDMAAVYRLRVDDDRLLNVSNHVRAWLLDGKK